MKRSRLLYLVLLAAVIAIAVGSAGTMTVTSSGFEAAQSARPCVEDADCPGGQICCPISGLCTNVRGCRKDPL